MGPARLAEWGQERRAAVGAMACAVLAGCSALAGCAGAAAGPQPAVCAQAGSITRLVIHRVNDLPQNHERFSFPALITVTSASRAQTVAQALCALPVMPGGTYSCPADWGISYRLVFTARSGRLPPVTADASGCGTVNGLGAVRWTIQSPGFWLALARAAGISPASGETFLGTMP